MTAFSRQGGHKSVMAYTGMSGPSGAEDPGDLTTLQAGCDPDGTQASGALYRICMPFAPFVWNGGLVVYAHGYVTPTAPLSIPAEADQVALLAIPQGYAFATTSYRTNGLAVVEGIADLVDLVNIFKTQKGAPNKVYLVGVSEGGLITTLAVEQNPDVFSGGLAMCGPYGDFREQINYFGDFRVVFDYFFPELLPGSPISIPVSLTDNWSSYSLTVTQVIENPANSGLVDQLFSVTHAPYDAATPSTKTETTLDLLWYNVFATNDALVKLGGQPFDNQSRLYAGSADDVLLNQGVQRFGADQAALNEVDAQYQATGVLTVPLVTLHTTGDPIIPYWHVARYIGKTIAADNIALQQHNRVERYGHCNFTQTETLNAFSQLVSLVNNPPAYQPVRRLFLPMVTGAPF